MKYIPLLLVRTCFEGASILPHRDLVVDLLALRSLGFVRLLEALADQGSTRIHIRNVSHSRSAPERARHLAWHSRCHFLARLPSFFCFSGNTQAHTHRDETLIFRLLIIIIIMDRERWGASLDSTYYTHTHKRERERENLESICIYVYDFSHYVSRETLNIHAPKLMTKWMNGWSCLERCNKRHVCQAITAR